MPGWGGCDVCAVMEELRVVLDVRALPAPASFNGLTTVVLLGEYS